MERASNLVELPERLRKASEAAAFLSVSLSWLRHATAAGIVPCVRFGGHVRYDLAQLGEWARAGGKSVANLLPLRRG